MRRAGLAVVAVAILLARPAAAATGAPRYDTQYLFAATRALVADPMADGWKALLAPATVIVDVVSLPFAGLLGFTGFAAGEASKTEGRESASGGGALVAPPPIASS
jgi:hypothetical protein